MIPYSKQEISSVDALRVAIQTKFRSLTQGPRISILEKAIAQYVGSKYAILVSSGTAGLHLSMLALGLKKNSEVITSPLSFVATSNAILYSGHTPKFCDINPDTLTLDFRNIESQITENTGAVITVHFAGLPDKPDSLSTIKKKYNLRIIEDAAHSFGAEYATGDKVGCCKFSDMTVFSLHPVKSMTTGEGGVITTNDLDLYKKLLRIRSHGINKLDDSFLSNLLSTTNGALNPWYYEMQELGFNYRLTEIQSELGLSQLNRLDGFINRRRILVQNYLELLQGNNIIRPAQQQTTLGSAHHIFPIRINFASSRINRNNLMKTLKSKGIGTQVHYIPIPLQPYYNALGFNVDDLPNAVDYYFETLTIPLFPKLKFRQQEKIIIELNNGLST